MTGKDKRSKPVRGKAIEIGNTSCKSILGCGGIQGSYLPMSLKYATMYLQLI